MTDRAFAITLFTFAFLLRVCAALVLDEGRAVFPDSREYLAVADNVVAGRGFVLDEQAKAKRPPGYAAFLAPFRWTFPSSLFPIQAGQALLGGLSCVLVFLLGRRLLDRRAAAFGGAACAVYPLLVFTGPALLIEALLATLLLLEVAFLVRAEGRPAWGLAAGLAGGAAILVQPGHALFLLAVALFRRGRFLGPYVAVILVVIGAWAARNTAVLGRFVPLTTHSGYTLYESLGPSATGGTVGHRIAWPERGAMSEVEYDAHLRRSALEGLTAARFARLAVEKQRRFWSVVPHAEEYRSPAAFAATLAFVPVLAGLVVALGKWRLAPRGAGWLILPALYLAAVHVVFLGSIRYRLAVEPFLVLVAAWGATRLLRRRAGPPPARSGSGSPPGAEASREPGA